jgi:hypothetical protein
MQRLDRVLEAALEILLPHMCFGPALVMQQLQLLSLRLFYLKMGDLSSKAVYLSLDGV